MFRLVPLLMVLVACGGSETASAPASSSVAVEAIPKEGKRFDPPVETSAIPSGAWMCDMGTVHYASSEPGTCPVCGMKLVQKK